MSYTYHLPGMFDIFNDNLIVTIKQTLLFYSFITENVKAQG